MAESAAGRPRFNEYERKAAAHPIEEVGRRLRALMPWMKEQQTVKERSAAE